MLIDLHIHTIASSDGEFSPQQIMQLAKDNQIQALAITDHDTIQSVEAAIHCGKEFGIEVIPGCEFSSMYSNKWLHILGYFIDHKHPAVIQWCDKIQKGRQNNVDAQISKLHEAGFYLDKSKVVEKSPQPMPISYSEAIFADERNNSNQVLNQYRLLENPALKFCVDWIVTGRPYNAPQMIPDVKDVIDLILQSGGVPILAHPAATLGPNDDCILYELLKMGIKGIEAFTTWHTPEQEEHYFRFCVKNRIVATCGSDFHGKSKPSIRIGQVRNNDYEVVRLLKRLQ